MSDYKDMVVPGPMVSALLKAVTANHRIAVLFGDVPHINAATEVLRTVQLAAAPAHHTVSTSDDEWIVKVWESMPGGPTEWLRGFGYVQFARAVLDAAPCDAVKANYWFDCLQKCAKLMEIPDDVPIPSGVVAAVTALSKSCPTVAPAPGFNWISADAELPPVGEDVLCLANGILRFAYMGLIDAPAATVGWNFDDDGEPAAVTHWMRLPEVPK